MTQPKSNSIEKTIEMLLEQAAAADNDDQLLLIQQQLKMLQMRINESNFDKKEEENVEDMEEKQENQEELKKEEDEELEQQDEKNQAAMYPDTIVTTNEPIKAFNDSANYSASVTDNGREIARLSYDPSILTKQNLYSFVQPVPSPKGNALNREDDYVSSLNSAPTLHP